MMGTYGANTLFFLSVTLVANALSLTETIRSQSYGTHHTFKSNIALASTASDAQTHSSFSNAISTSTVQSIPTPQNLLDGRISLRLATKDDIPNIQECNLATMAENYPLNHYNNLLSRWPDLALVAEYFPSNGKRSIVSNSIELEDDQQKSEIVGYILGKVVQGGYHYSSLPPGLRNDSPLNDHEGSVPTVSLAKHRGHITSIGIMPVFRRRGLAALLMDQVHLHLRSGYHISHVGLNVRLDNAAAKYLYGERFGYDASSIINRYYADDADALFMLKNLNTADDEAVAIKNPDSIDMDGNQILNGWKLVKDNLILFCNEQINRTLVSYRGRNWNNFNNPIWENGPVTSRLPRDIAHCGKGLKQQ